jgi:hypothetical protein
MRLVTAFSYDEILEILANVQAFYAQGELVAE